MEANPLALSPLSSPTDYFSASPSVTPSFFDAYHLDDKAGATSMDMSIADLCQHIRGSASALSSQITRMEWKKEEHGVRHEFLINEYLYRPAEQAPESPSLYASPDELVQSSPVSCFLRLDRAANVNAVQQAHHGRPALLSRSSSSMFPASDSVRGTGPFSMQSMELTRHHLISGYSGPHLQIERCPAISQSRYT